MGFFSCVEQEKRRRKQRRKWPFIQAVKLQNEIPKSG